MTYRHLNKGTLAELIEKKELTVKVKLTETGEEKEIGSATFKRWWKPVPMQTEIPEIPENGMPDNETAESETLPDEPETSRTESEPSPPKETADEEKHESKDVQGDNRLALSEVVCKLENLFDILNGLYFEDKLPRPVITVQSTPKAYGHCSTKKIWKSEGEEQYEINIGAEFLNRPSEQTAATMCHEMIHLYCRENEIDETCQRGRYHNKIFKIEAANRDLHIDYDRTVGYSITAPTEAFIEKLRKAGYELKVPFARFTPEKAKVKADREKAHKYFCPICGQEVRTTQELSLICGICELPMERDN
jgi:hypothetical protein